MRLKELDTLKEMAQHIDEVRVVVGEGHEIPYGASLEEAIARLCSAEDGVRVARNGPNQRQCRAPHTARVRVQPY